MQRWINMAQRGWYSGETHVHRSLKELPNVMLAEDLNVAFPLAYWVTEAFTVPRRGSKTMAEDPGPKPIRVDQSHVIYPRNTEYEIFTTVKRPHTLGAFFVLNHKKTFTRGVPPVRGLSRQAHAEGGLIDLDKPNWPWTVVLIAVMKPDLYELANNHVWRTEFGLPKFGEQPPDYMKIEKDARGFTDWGWLDFTFKNYYTVLNCGFRLRPTAGTASGVHPVPLGFGRVYVQLDKGFGYNAWVKGLNAGRSFVTTGPMLFVTMDGQAPGHTFRSSNKASGQYGITGSAISGHPLQSIEIIVNGDIAKTVKPGNRQTKAGAYESIIDARVTIDGSSWVAVRCFEDRPDRRVRFAHSAPFYVDVGLRPLRPRRVEVEYLIKRVEEQIARSLALLPKRAKAEYREALGVYKRLAKTAR
jgi:hypothetical protein